MNPHYVNCFLISQTGECKIEFLWRVIILKGKKGKVGLKMNKTAQRGLRNTPRNVLNIQLQSILIIL